MTRLVHLNALHALEAALRHGTLRKAADELGVTQAAIGQRIRGLENYLGYPLLQRDVSGVSPTEIASAIAADLRTAIGYLDKVARALNFDHDGAVRLRVDPDFLVLWLRDRLPDFHHRHPAIALELLAVEASAAQSADIEIFWGSRPGCAALWQDRLVPVFSLEFVDIAKANGPTNLLEGLPLLHLVDKPGTENLGWTTWVENHGHRRTGANRGMSVRSFADGIATAKAGAGVFLAPSLLVQDLLDQGELKPMTVPNPGLETENTFCIDVVERSLQKQSVTTFARWLVETATQFAARRQI